MPAARIRRIQGTGHAVDPKAYMLGRAIRAGRRLRGETQDSLAAGLRMSPKTVQAWEYGGNMITLRSLFDVARVLRIPAWRLLRVAERAAAGERQSEVKALTGGL